MHELLLFGNVPPSRHTFVLNALAGLTAMQPQPFNERHLIYRPIRETGTPAAKSVQTHALKLGVPLPFVRDLFYIQLVGCLDSNQQSQGDQAVQDGKGSEQSEFETAQWTLEYRDFPEVPGKKVATSRVMHTQSPPAGTSPAAFVERLGYQ